MATATALAHRYGSATQTAEGYAVGAALLLGSAGMIAKSVIRFREKPDVSFVLSRRDRFAAVAIGVVGGFIVGLTSVGSGVFFGLTMLIVFPLRAHKIVGTDIVHAAALLWVPESLIS